MSRLVARRLGVLFAVLLLIGACEASTPSGPPSPGARGERASASPALAPLSTPDPTATASPRRTPIPRPTPTPTPAPRVLTDEVLATNTTPGAVMAIDARGEDICAIRADGRIACWGYYATAAPAGTFRSVSLGSGGACAIRTDGTLACWRIEDGWEVPAPRGTFSAVSVSSSIDGGAVGSKCAVRSNGKLVCWNDNQDDNGVPGAFELATGQPEGRFTTVAESGAGWCALRLDQTLACWADEEYADLPTFPDGTYRSVSGSCAVRTSGDLVCLTYEWMDNQPAYPEGGSFIDVSQASMMRGCALRTDGSLACWGTEIDADGFDLPLRAAPGTFDAVSVGDTWVCGRHPDGKAVCWGQSDEYARPAPQMVLTGPEWSDRLTVPLRWRAAPAFANVIGYDVERITAFDENGVATSTTPLFTATTTQRASQGGRPGEELCWRARAHDADGMVSAWSYQCTKLPDDDLAFSHSAGWTTVSGGRYYAGHAALATRRGATLSFQTETGGIGLMATTCPACGTIRMYVNGEPWGAISLRSATTRDRHIVFWSDNGEMGFYGANDVGPATITIKVISRGRPVLIDGIVTDRCPGCS